MYDTKSFIALLDAATSIPAGTAGEDSQKQNTEYRKLISDLREEADWIGDNNYEVPVMLYDHILAAADALEIMLALHQNGESALDTRCTILERLAASTKTLDKALDLACEHLEKIGGCKNLDDKAVCDRTGCDFSDKRVCAGCMRMSFLSTAEKNTDNKENE